MSDIQPGDIIKITSESILPFTSEWTGSFGIVIERETKPNKYMGGDQPRWVVFHTDPTPGGVDQIQVWYVERLEKVC